jgi:excisionase family DNA binding protein
MSVAVYTVATLAERWGCCTDTVYGLIRSGSLAAFKIGGRHLRIRAIEVERYECQSNTPADSLDLAPPTDKSTDLRLERLTDRAPQLGYVGRPRRR